MNTLSQDHIEILRASGIDETRLPMTMSKTAKPEPRQRSKAEKATVAPVSNSISEQRSAGTRSPKPASLKPRTPPAQTFSPVAWPYLLLFVVIVILVALANSSGR